MMCCDADTDVSGEAESYYYVKVIQLNGSNKSESGQFCNSCGLRVQWRSFEQLGPLQVGQDESGRGSRVCQRGISGSGSGCCVILEIIAGVDVTITYDSGQTEGESVKSAG